jgi:hypothetical protein
MRWPAVVAAVLGFPIVEHRRELPADSDARTLRPTAADTGEIVYQGLIFRAPAGVWARRESPQSLVLTHDVSPQRVQRITVFPVPVPEPVRALLRWMPPRPDTLVAMRTAGSQSRTGLVGQWSYPYARLHRPVRGSMPGLDSAIAFETYTADGRFHFRIPLRPERMRYRVGADTLFIEGAPLPGGRARWQWVISRDALRITLLENPGAPPTLYVRPPRQ